MADPARDLPLLITKTRQFLVCLSQTCTLSEVASKLFEELETFLENISPQVADSSNLADYEVCEADERCVDALPTITTGEGQAGDSASLRSARSSVTDETWPADEQTKGKARNTFQQMSFRGVAKLFKRKGSHQSDSNKQLHLAPSAAELNSLESKSIDDFEQDNMPADYVYQASMIELMEKTGLFARTEKPRYVRLSVDNVFHVYRDENYTSLAYKLDLKGFTVSELSQRYGFMLFKVNSDELRKFDCIAPSRRTAWVRHLVSAIDRANHGIIMDQREEDLSGSGLTSADSDGLLLPAKPRYHQDDDHLATQDDNGNIYESFDITSSTDPDEADYKNPRDTMPVAPTTPKSERRKSRSLPDITEGNGAMPPRLPPRNYRKPGKVGPVRHNLNAVNRSNLSESDLQASYEDISEAACSGIRPPAKRNKNNSIRDAKTEYHGLYPRESLQPKLPVPLPPLPKLSADQAHHSYNLPNCSDSASEQTNNANSSNSEDHSPAISSDRTPTESDDVSAVAMRNKPAEDRTTETVKQLSIVPEAIDSGSDEEATQPNKADVLNNNATSKEDGDKGSQTATTTVTSRVKAIKAQMNAASNGAVASQHKPTLKSGRPPKPAIPLNKPRPPLGVKPPLPKKTTVGNSLLLPPPPPPLPSSSGDHNDAPSSVR